MLAACLLSAALVASQAAPASGEEGHDATVHHGFDDVTKWVAVFDDPERDAWQKPDEVLRAVRVAPTRTVRRTGDGRPYTSLPAVTLGTGGAQIVTS